METITDKHIILSALGSKGDIHPLVGLALGLRNKGAKKISFLVNDDYEDLITLHDFNFISTGDKKSQKAFTENKQLWDNRHDILKIGWDGLIRKSIENAFYAVEAAHNSGDKILVIGLQSIYNGALLAAEALRIPSVHITLSPQLIAIHSNSIPPAPLKWYFYKTRRNTSPEELIKKIRAKSKKGTMKQRYFKEYNAFRIQNKLTPIEDFSQNTILTKQSLQLCLFPSWFGMPTSDWPSNLTLTGFPLFDGIQKTLPKAVEQFIQEQGKPILFSFGTGFFNTEKKFKIGMQVSNQLGLPALFVGGSLDSNSFKSKQHMHCTYADFETLLPKCKAIIHHGGIGTMAQAIRAGIPQIICPKAFDQFDNADKIYHLGLGSFILKRKFNTKNLTQIVKSCIESTKIRHNIRFYQTLLKNKNPIQTACNTIEKYLETPKSLRSFNPLKRAIIRKLEENGDPQKFNIPLIKVLSNQQNTNSTTLTNGNYEAAAMLCQYFNKPVSLTQLYQSHPNAFNLKDISDCLQQQSLSPRIIQCPKENITQLKLPCLIFWQNSRFVILMRYDSEKIYIRDPLLEQQSYPIHFFAWHYNEIAIEVTSFKKQT